MRARGFIYFIAVRIYLLHWHSLQQQALLGHHTSLPAIGNTAGKVPLRGIIRHLI
jgi:hypothetical protein